MCSDGWLLQQTFPLASMKVGPFPRLGDHYNVPMFWGLMSPSYSPSFPPPRSIQIHKPASKRPRGEEKVPYLISSSDVYHTRQTAWAISLWTAYCRRATEGESLVSVERQLCGLVVSDPLSSEAATRNHTDFNHTGWYVGDIVFCIQWVFVYLSESQTNKHAHLPVSLSRTTCLWSTCLWSAV